MDDELSDIQQKTLTELQIFIGKHGYPPTVGELADKLKRTKASVHGTLDPNHPAAQTSCRSTQGLSRHHETGHPNPEHGLMSPFAPRNPSKTALFLDALDEDYEAIRSGHRKRLDQILELTKPFSHVIITCRTQFFPSEDEIPRKTGISRIGPRNAGDAGVYEFVRYYLSPFGDDDIKKYLKRRYPFWKYRERKRATTFATEKIPKLCARPMLLAYLPEVIETDQQITNISDLYSVMVNAWYERESSWVKRDALRAFSERIAFDIFVNRSSRKSEKISKQEMIELARGWSLNVPFNHLSSRSLLNRDAEDFCEFAHSFILEYLFVAHLCRQTSLSFKEVELTGMSRLFLAENFGVSKIEVERIERVVSSSEQKTQVPLSLNWDKEFVFLCDESSRRLLWHHERNDSHPFPISQGKSVDNTQLFKWIAESVWKRSSRLKGLQEQYVIEAQQSSNHSAAVNGILSAAFNPASGAACLLLQGGFAVVYLKRDSESKRKVLTLVGPSSWSCSAKK